MSTVNVFGGALAVAEWSKLAVPIAAGLIVVLTLLFGWRDVKRFNFRRVRAIAGVSFSESIRRRVLWVIPLAIIGVIAVTQLTRPFDAQDAVRQTTKYCVFATGLIVVVAAVILACTNLPKEIESRVIFTIVTKPTTRLEIVVGKVLGFAAISLLILAIMAAFTATYSYSRAWALENSLRDNLAADTTLTRAERERYTEYVEAGLLDTKAVRVFDDLQIYAKLPDPNGIRWFSGNLVYMTVPFAPTAEQRNAFRAAVESGAAPAMIVTLRVDRRPKLADFEQEELATGQHPLEGGEGFGPFLQDAQNAVLPQISVSVHAQDDGRFIGNDVFQAKYFGAERNRDWKPGGDRVFLIPITSVEALEDLLAEERFNVEVLGVTPGLLYGTGDVPIQLVALDPKTGIPAVTISSSKDVPVDSLSHHPDDHGHHTPPGVRILSRMGRTGMQLEGRTTAEGEPAVAVFSFNNVTGIEPQDGKVTLQSNVLVDRIGLLDAENAQASLVSFVVRNRTTGYETPPTVLELDAARQIDLRMPAQAFEGGNFDVLVRGLTSSQFLGVNDVHSSQPSILLVQAHHSFLMNLGKGMLVLWLLSILVVTIAVFCSTFLSWPIAVVLTVMLLLGRWGVEQLGESVDPGASRSWVSQLFGVQDAARNQAVTESMEMLTAVLRNTAPVLPDVGRFPVIEDLDRGLSMPLAKVWRAMLELLLYGLPLVLLTYVVFRNKEVAP